jgi:hypothetical protein
MSGTDGIAELRKEHQVGTYFAIVGIALSFIFLGISLIALSLAPTKSFTIGIIAYFIGIIAYFFVFGIVTVGAIFLFLKIKKK